MIDYISERAINNLSEAFIFTNPRTNTSYSAYAVCDIWDRARKKGNIPNHIRLYDITRHSLASQMANNGVSPFIIQQLLGHTSIKTTSKYMHGNIESVKSAIDVFSFKDKIVEFKPSPNRHQIKK